MDVFRRNSPTRENLGLLAVMEALEGQERITQRELAQATGLNLKKVNYCLHKLLEKGYIKFQRARRNPDKRAYLYILTPAGLKAKSELTYDFLKLTLNFYNRVEQKLQDCLTAMQTQGVTRVVLYGVGDITRILLGMMNGSIEVVAIVDEKYPGHEFHELPVIKLEKMRDYAWDGLLVTELEDFESIQDRFIEDGLAEEKIWRLF